MKKYIIALITIVLIVGGVVLTKYFDTRSEEVSCTMEAKQCPDGSYVGRSGLKCEFEACPGVDKISDWKIYRNEQYRFELRYPNVSKFQVYPNTRSTQIYLDIPKTYNIQIYIDDSNHTDSIYCHLGLCNLPAKSKVNYNGVVWDYLGNNFLDTGSPVQLRDVDVFRTKKGVFVYYVKIDLSRSGNRNFLKNIKLY